MTLKKNNLNDYYVEACNELINASTRLLQLTGVAVLTFIFMLPALWTFSLVIVELYNFFSNLDAAGVVFFLGLGALELLIVPHIAGFIIGYLRYKKGAYRYVPPDWSSSVK